MFHRKLVVLHRDFLHPGQGKRCILLPERLLLIVPQYDAILLEQVGQALFYLAHDVVSLNPLSDLRRSSRTHLLSLWSSCRSIPLPLPRHFPACCSSPTPRRPGPGRFFLLPAGRGSPSRTACNPPASR